MTDENEVQVDAAAALTEQPTQQDVAPELNAPDAPEASLTISDVDVPAKTVTVEASEHATAPATSESGPSADDLDAASAEEAARLATSAPPSLENTTSHLKATPGGPSVPSYDSDVMDSTGENKKEDGIPGPRGENAPLDVMSDAERAQIAVKHEEKLRQGMSSTHAVDSAGNPKGEFETEVLGHDKHGSRVPDFVDYSRPVEPVPPMVGPRGVGAPKDTFHKR